MPLEASCSEVRTAELTFSSNGYSLRLRLHGTLERFCMEPFGVGTDRLPVYTMPWNRSVQNPSFQSIHA